MKLQKKQFGFTMVELLVVVGIIAILLTLMLVNLNRTRATSRDTVRVAHIQQIRLALEEYKAQCREYPNRLELSANNGCPDGFSLGSVLAEIPENPGYQETPTFVIETEDADDAHDFNGYYYSGLTTQLGSPCYEYHLGVALESGRVSDSEYRIGEYLNQDHDCEQRSMSNPPYVTLCPLSEPDFEHAEDDSTYGVYDFRSSNTCQ